MEFLPSCVNTIAWTLTKYKEKRLDGNPKRMLCAILNIFLKQQIIKQQLYSHLPPISNTFQLRWTRYTVHCWRSKDKFISDVFQWIQYTWMCQCLPTSKNWHELCADTWSGCEDLPGTIGDRDRWRGRDKELCAESTTWWWTNQNPS